MANLKVNATQVISVAKKIKGLNEQMRDDLGNVQDAINLLNNAWDSRAADSAMRKFNTIKNAYCDARYNVIDNFVAFLHHQVGEGYEQTETTNKSLADQFK